VRIKDFNKLKKQLDPQKIIRKHCNLEIYLTDRQLQEIIDLKNKPVRRTHE
jgi:hypothetical protein